MLMFEGNEVSLRRSKTLLWRIWRKLLDTFKSSRSEKSTGSLWVRIFTFSVSSIVFDLHASLAVLGPVTQTCHLLLRCVPGSPPVRKISPSLLRIWGICNLAPNCPIWFPSFILMKPRPIAHFINFQMWLAYGGLHVSIYTYLFLKHVPGLLILQNLAQILYFSHSFLFNGLVCTKVLLMEGVPRI